jgi:hypothetical protein
MSGFKKCRLNCKIELGIFIYVEYFLAGKLPAEKLLYF